MQALTRMDTQTSTRKKIPVVATRAASSKQFTFVHWTRAQTSQTDSEGNDPPSPPGQEHFSADSPVHTAFAQHFSSPLCSFECC